MSDKDVGLRTFSPIVSRFFRLLSHCLAFSRIVSPSLALSRLLSHCLAFSRIFHAFSRVFRMFTYVSRVFFRILSRFSRFSCFFSHSLAISRGFSSLLARLSITTIAFVCTFTML
jgi:hypothetical protein